MGRVNTPKLTPEQQHELTTGFKQSKSHCFRMRCHAIILKSEGRTSKEVGSITGMHHISVNSWTKRFKEQGIAGLQTQAGRGRKALITSSDKEAVLQAIKLNRQRLRTAKAEWEQQSGKSVCINTFKAFLKSLAEDINA